jgi:enoyl-CoA hydratase/carnithine racemase
VEREGPVATVVLDRPDRLNAQTPHTWAALREAGRSLPEDVRVVVVRGEGRSFSAGLDRDAFTPGGIPGAPGLPELAAMPAERSDTILRSYQAAFGWLRRPDIISVAAVQGHAIGAGFQLALACDLRVLADDARLSMAEATYGLVPDLGGTAPLVAAVGYSRALELCVTARKVGADEARELGLATLVVPRPQLDGAVADLVSALLGPLPDAVTEIKALLLGAADRTREEQEAAERSAQQRRFGALLDGLKGG